MDLTEQNKYKRIFEVKICAARRILERTEKVVAEEDYRRHLTLLESIRMRKVAIETHNQLKAEIIRFERALSLIETGRYGSCLNCGVEIQAKRLKIYPDEVICSGCKN